jgi:hypothetical protein
MSGLRRKPLAEELSIAVQIQRRPILHRPLSRRWNHRGIGGYAILADIEAPERPRLKRHVPNHVESQKSTFGREVPIVGLGGIQTYRIVRDVMELEALPAKSKEKAE